MMMIPRESFHKFLFFQDHEEERSIARTCILFYFILNTLRSRSCPVVHPPIINILPEGQREEIFFLWSCQRKSHRVHTKLPSLSDHRWLFFFWSTVFFLGKRFPPLFFSNWRASLARVYIIPPTKHIFFFALISNSWLTSFPYLTFFYPFLKECRWYISLCIDAGEFVLNQRKFTGN
jgi:hypothetical protein